MFDKIIYGCLFLATIVCFGQVFAVENKAGPEEAVRAEKCEIAIQTTNIVHPRFGGVVTPLEIIKWSVR